MIAITKRMVMSLWPLGLALPFCAAAETVEYIHTDALGTPVAITDSAGNVVETSEYEPYGRLLNRPLTDGPGYAGHVQDAATTLTYMQQRYYDPAVGRFLSVDPVTAYSNPVGAFNRYKYAANNPYRFIDPDGRVEKTFDPIKELGPLDQESHYRETKVWPVPGHREINKADKKGEGKGEFGTPRNTAKGPSTHSGVDIQAPQGARVVSTEDGVVANVKPNPSATYGNQVVVQHGEGRFTQYAHLQSMSVKPGQDVVAGQEIGAVGRTGNTPALGDTHLHFELRGSSAPRSAGGAVSDPVPYLQDAE